MHKLKGLVENAVTGYVTNVQEKNEAQGEIKPDKEHWKRR